MKTQIKQGKFGAQDFMDLALIESVKRGNKEAFTLLYKKYYPFMYRKLMYSLRNKQDAEDITSEIFQKIYENIDKYEKQYTFNAWVTKLAHNYMIDFIHKNKKDVIAYNSISIDEPVFQDESEVEFQIPSQEPELLTASEKVERMAKLKVAYDAINNLPNLAIENLPVKTGFIFKKFNFDEKTPFDISEELQMDIKEVEEHIKKAYERYDQAVLEQRILEMYLKEELPYEVIAKKVKMNLNTLKVTILRAKDKVIKSIDLRKAVIEVASVYNIEQLNVDDWYTILKPENNIQE
jgi:RNA polymerase sigma-70 factor (ECF subfamily)